MYAVPGSSEIGPIGFAPCSSAYLFRYWIDRGKFCWSIAVGIISEFKSLLKGAIEFSISETLDYILLIFTLSNSSFNYYSRAFSLSKTSFAAWFSNAIFY